MTDQGSDPNYPVKDEKDEKELSKHEEKSREEKYRRDPLGTTVWALVLIWLGVVLLANNMGWLDPISGFLRRLSIGIYPPFEIPFFDFSAWSIFFLGWGLIVLGEVVIRLLVPAYRRPILGSFIWALVLFGIGIGNWNLIWPLVIIAIGIVVLFRALRR
jgi:hypothetical protein